MQEEDGIDAEEGQRRLFRFATFLAKTEYVIVRDNIFDEIQMCDYHKTTIATLEYFASF